MTLNQLQRSLNNHPRSFPRFVLPGGDSIPAHAHITEVGHVVRSFIDCGGMTGKEEKAVLQTHVGADIDHRLQSDRLSKILDLGKRVMPTSGVPVEVEYDCCVVSQYPITEVRSEGENLFVFLGRSQTQCRAAGRSETAAGSGDGMDESACCG